jgi:hypothetical protein
MIGKATLVPPANRPRGAAIRRINFRGETFKVRPEFFTRLKDALLTDDTLTHQLYRDAGGDYLILNSNPTDIIARFLRANYDCAVTKNERVFIRKSVVSALSKTIAKHIPFERLK